MAYKLLRFNRETWKKCQLALNLVRKIPRRSLFHNRERIDKNKMHKSSILLLKTYKWLKIPNASKFRINEIFSPQLPGIYNAVFLKVDWLTVCRRFIKQYLYLISYLAKVKNAPKNHLKPPLEPHVFLLKNLLQSHFKQEMVVVVFNLNLKVKPKIVTFYIGTNLS